MHSSGKNSLAVGLSPYKIAKEDAFASKLAGRLFSPFYMARSVHKIFTKKISTHLLTVLITSVIVRIEQRKRDTKRGKEENLRYPEAFPFQRNR